MWHARWLILARRAWPVLTVLAITANLLVLPEYTRSLLTRTIRAELPAAHLTPAEYVTIQICYVAVFMLICLAVATVIYVRAAREPVALYCAYTLMALGCGFGFLAGLTSPPLRPFTRCASGSSGPWTGSSTGPATTPTRPSPPSPPGCRTQPTPMPSTPTCSALCTRRWNPPTPRSGSTSGNRPPDHPGTI